MNLHLQRIENGMSRYARLPFTVQDLTDRAIPVHAVRPAPLTTERGTRGYEPFDCG